MSNGDFKPSGWPTIAPRIVVEDTQGLVDFLHDVFEATGRHQTQRPSEIWIGGSVILISQPGVRPPQAGFLYVYVGDTDGTYRRALAAGARSLEAPTELPYGDWRCMVEDPWGNTWQIATRLRR